MVKEKLIEKFGGDVNHMSCCYLRNGEGVLRSFLQPCDTIIEIGTYRGVSACVLSEYAKKVHTFDVVDKPLRKQFVDYLGVKNIEFHLVKNRVQERNEIDKIFKKEKVDLVFIDGEHFNGELKRDYEMCKECDTILVHDYSPSFPEIYDFINSLEGYEKKVNDTFILLRRTAKSEPVKKTKEKKIKIKRKLKSKS